MLRKQLPLLVLMLAVGLLRQGQQPDPQAVLFKRDDRGGAVNRIIEDTFSLKIDVKPEQKAMVAVRVCSKDPLPFSLVTSSSDPFFITEQLVSAYGYAPERLVYLRSEDCLGTDPSRGVAEIWALSQGASFPPHIERVAFTDAQRVALGKKEGFRGARDYREAVIGLIKELQVNSEARGLVIAYYEDRGKLNPKLRRRLKEVTSMFERSGLSRDRYLVHITYWNDESWEHEPET